MEDIKQKQDEELDSALENFGKTIDQSILNALYQGFQIKEVTAIGVKWNTEDMVKETDDGKVTIEPAEIKQLRGNDDRDRFVSMCTSENKRGEIYPKTPPIRQAVKNAEDVEEFRELLVERFGAVGDEDDE